MALMLGNWNIVANGHEGQLQITGVDAQGNLSGTVFGHGILGFWDERSQKITFMRLQIPGQPNTFQIYTGYLFSYFVSGNNTHILTGSFEAFQGGGGVAQRSVYGWFANISETNF